MKYSLTFRQRLELIPIGIMWFFTANSNRKSWHEVKKGMEKHECKFTKPETVYYNGKPYYFMKCEHEGCNTCDPVEDVELTMKLNRLESEFYVLKKSRHLATIK